MRAVVLVGGEGTRLRPLTETIPKPLLPLVDRPILDHVLDHLVRHGVDEVIMSSPYLEATFHPFIAARGDVPTITWITEREPLGTGGAIVSVLERLGDEPFLALNGDILTDLDLGAMRAIHGERSAAVTIALHRAEDARPFGLVETEPDGRVTAFREKPSDPIPGEVNAGTYLLDPSVLRTWEPGTPISIETEIFPALIRGGVSVFGFPADAYWLDLGTPAQYLRAHVDLLAGRLAGSAYPSPWVGPGATVDATAQVAPTVAVGPGVTIAAGAAIESSVLLRGASVGSGARVAGSILGPDSVVGATADVRDSVVGPGARIPTGARLHGDRVAAG
jgi:mannose-1-phosphate guanylyltransferase